MRMTTESRVYEYVEDMRFVGDLANANASGSSSVDGQSPHTTLQLVIREDIVHEARFRTSGCGFMIACVGALIELVVGRTLDACLLVTEQEVVDRLQGVPPHRRYCAELAITALKSAIEGYRNTQMPPSN